MALPWSTVGTAARRTALGGGVFQNPVSSSVEFSPFVQVRTVSLRRVPTSSVLQHLLLHRADGTRMPRSWVHGEIPTEASALKACTHPITVFPSTVGTGPG